MAWLHAVPDEPKDNKKTRYSLLPAEDYRRKLPDVLGCDDLLIAFRDSGMVMSGGMGATPLTWQEIDAMNSGGCYGLNSWDKRQIREMSVNYCSVLHRATKNMPCPNQREATTEEKQALGLAQLRAMERAEQANNEIIKSKKPR